MPAPGMQTHFLGDGIKMEANSVWARTVFGKSETFPIAIYDKAIRKYFDIYTLICKYEKCLNQKLPFSQ